MVSAVTICNVWLKEGMETRYQRLLRLEEKAAAEGFELTEEHIRLLEKANPWMLCKPTWMSGFVTTTTSDLTEAIGIWEDRLRRLNLRKNRKKN